VQAHLDAEGTLPVLLLDPALDEELQACFGEGGRGPAERSPITAPVVRRLADSLKRLSGGAGATAWPVLLCQSPARYHIRRWLEPAVPRVTVLAPSEVPADVRVRSLGTVR
jgi:flagellar biosynthesis protein FlhA